MIDDNWWDDYSYDENKLQYVIPNYRIERFKNKVNYLEQELETTKKQLKFAKDALVDADKVLDDEPGASGREAARLIGETLAKLSKEEGL